MKDKPRDTDHEYLYLEKDWINFVFIGSTMKVVLATFSFDIHFIHFYTTPIPISHSFLAIIRHQFCSYLVLPSSYHSLTSLITVFNIELELLSCKNVNYAVVAVGVCDITCGVS